jgi:hypothetical protein
MNKTTRAAVEYVLLQQQYTSAVGHDCPWQDASKDEKLERIQTEF